MAGKLDEVGIDVADHRGRAKGRASTIARIEGTDSSRAPLLIHGHLDVVPADKDEWSVDPFAGEIKDGFVWGRGAIDMKDMDAMTLALVREWARAGQASRRATSSSRSSSDEEAGGRKGAHYLVDNHADLFADCTEAISEVGGFSISLNENARVYAIQTAEKGINWLRLTANAPPGHGSMVHDDNAVTMLAARGRPHRRVRLAGRHHRHRARHRPGAVARSAAASSTRTTPDEWLPLLGSAARMIGATIRNTANPTMLEAGYKTNVIPSRARRRSTPASCPARRTHLLETIDELIGEGIEREFEVRDIAVETSFDGELVDAMSAALKAEDPGALPSRT